MVLFDLRCLGISEDCYNIIGELDNRKDNVKSSDFLQNINNKEGD